MDVIIDGIKYIPAKEAIANRDAVIRGILNYYWGELGDDYDEDTKCNGVYCVITDDPKFSHHPSPKDIADMVAEYSTDKKN